LDTMPGKNVSSFFLFRQPLVPAYLFSCQARETLLDYCIFHGLMLVSMLDRIQEQMYRQFNYWQL
jgi:hypothetical protein